MSSSRPMSSVESATRPATRPRRGVAGVGTESFCKSSALSATAWGPGSTPSCSDSARRSRANTASASGTRPDPASARIRSTCAVSSSGSASQRFSASSTAVAWSPVAIATEMRRRSNSSSSRLARVLNSPARSSVSPPRSSPGAPRHQRAAVRSDSASPASMRSATISRSVRHPVSRYPLPSPSIDADPRSGRRREIWVCRAADGALGGRSPQTSPMRRSVLRARPPASTRATSRRRARTPGTATKVSGDDVSVPELSTATGPSTPTTVVPVRAGEAVVDTQTG